MGMLDSCRNQGEKQAGNSTPLPETSPAGHCAVKPGEAWPTFIHVLSDDVDGFLGHHGVQLDQLVVLQLLHDLRFLEERFRGHCAWFKSLYGYFCVSIPGTCRHPTILSQTKGPLLMEKKFLS